MTSSVGITSSYAIANSELNERRCREYSGGKYISLKKNPRRKRYFLEASVARTDDILHEKLTFQTRLHGRPTGIGLRI